MPGEVIMIYLFLSVIIITHGATFVLPWGKGGYRRMFSFLCAAVSLYLFAYLLEVFSFEPENKIFWNAVGYIGMVLSISLWCSMLILYVRRDMMLGWKTFLVLFLIPTITVVLRLTNDFHHLSYRGYITQRTPGFSLLLIQHGPVFAVQMTFCFLLMVFALLLLFRQLFNASGREKNRYYILIAATLVPGIATGFRLLRAQGPAFDDTALAIPLSMLLIFVAIKRYDFLEIKAFVRDSVFENNPDGMILLDLDGHVLDYNKEALRIFSEMKIPVKYLSIEELLKNRIDLQKVFLSEKTKGFRTETDGVDKYYEVGTGIMRDPAGKKIGILKTIWDLTEEKREQDFIRQEAETDELTSLNNRRHFLKLASDEFDRAFRKNSRFCMLMMDIDHFKEINDTCGHAAGDEVLRKIGELMLDRFRSTDICGRIGGEELAVILLDLEPADAKNIAEKFRKDIEMTEFSFQETKIRLTISIGVAAFSKKQENFQEVMLRADEALYESKANGRNRTTLYTG